MRLDEVVKGKVYVDVNVFYMYLRPDPVYLPMIRRFWGGWFREILRPIPPF